MRAAAGYGEARTAVTGASGVLAGSTAALVMLALLALGFVFYVLWPRWPDMPVAMDSPALPIVVGEVVFRVPPAAIRAKVQRHPGKQERIDLVYRWPDLTPAALKGKNEAAPLSAERIFVTITAATSSLTPADRLKIIYPRYAEQTGSKGPDGLISVAFRTGTPYQGEDLIFNHTAPDRFLVRCMREKGPVPGTCLLDRFIGRANVTVRFPRDWLVNWRSVASGVDRLIAQLQPVSG